MISETERMVWEWLKERAGVDGAVAFVTVPMVAEATGLDRSVVRVALLELERWRLIDLDGALYVVRSAAPAEVRRAG